MSSIPELVQVFNDVTGLDEEQAKTCIFWCGATYHISDFDSHFPILEAQGPTGTGKTSMRKVIQQLAKNPGKEISCKHITTSELRTELASRWERTALLEETEEVRELKASEQLISARCSRSTSSIGYKVKGKGSNWVPSSEDVFGATFVHHRQPFIDQATQNRVITITTCFIPNRTFIEPPSGLTLPSLALKPFAKSDKVAGRVFDTWKPLLYIANWLDDEYWLYWVQFKMEEAGEELRDGQSFEMKSTILYKLIEVLEINGRLIMKAVNVDGEITKILKDRSMPWLTPQQVNSVLRGLGIHIERRGGRLMAYPTLDSVKGAADKLGIEDKLL